MTVRGRRHPCRVLWPPTQRLTAENWGPGLTLGTGCSSTCQPPLQCPRSPAPPAPRCGWEEGRFAALGSHCVQGPVRLLLGHVSGCIGSNEPEESPGTRPESVDPLSCGFIQRHPQRQSPPYTERATASRAGTALALFAADPGLIPNVIEGARSIELGAVHEHRAS